MCALPGSLASAGLLSTVRDVSSRPQMETCHQDAARRTACRVHQQAEGTHYTPGGLCNCRGLAKGAVQTHDASRRLWRHGFAVGIGNTLAHVVILHEDSCMH